jgi:hypothetical protein
MPHHALATATLLKLASHRANPMPNIREMMWGWKVKVDVSSSSVTPSYPVLTTQVHHHVNCRWRRSCACSII